MRIKKEANLVVIEKYFLFYLYERKIIDVENIKGYLQNLINITNF